MYYYKVPILNGEFDLVDYNVIVEGVAFSSHTQLGYGYISTNIKLTEFEEISEDKFIAESRGGV